VLALHVVAAHPAHPHKPLGVAEQRNRSLAEFLSVKAGEHNATFRGTHEMLWPSARSHDDRHTGRERFRNNDAETLLERREDEQARRA
jgi:hypothetical protein